MHLRAQINRAAQDMTTDHRHLRAKGYIQLGIGAFSRVFYHPDRPDVVIKIGQRHARTQNGRGLRDAFPDFAWAILNGDIRSKFFPKIYRVIDDGARFCCVIKRYHKLDDRKVKRTIIKTGTNAAYYPGKPDNRRYGRVLTKLRAIYGSLDLHSGNIMRDRHGTPILTDPVCYRDR